MNSFLALQGITRRALRLNYVSPLICELTEEAGSSSGCACECVLNDLNFPTPPLPVPGPVLTVSCDSFSLLTDPAIDLIQFQDYSFALTATGGTLPYVWTLVSGSLPPGITISSGGTVSGISTVSGDFAATVQVSDAKTVPCVLLVNFTFHVVEAPNPCEGFDITTDADLGSANQGDEISPITFAASGGTGPYSWAVIVGSLPDGLTLSSGGILTGTPTSDPGTYDFTIRATDSSDPACQSDKAFSFTVNCNIPVEVVSPEFAAWAAALDGTVLGPIPTDGSTITFLGGSPDFFHYELIFTHSTRWNFNVHVFQDPAGLDDGWFYEGPDLACSPVAEGYAKIAGPGAINSVTIPDPISIIPAPFPTPSSYYKMEALFDGDGSADDAFDEIAGVYLSGNSTSLISGKIGNGFNLTDGNTLTRTNATFEFGNASWTMRLWVKALVVDGSFHSLGQRITANHGWRLYQDTDGSIKVDFGHGTYDTLTVGTLTPGNWERICFGYDKAQQFFFTKLNNDPTTKVTSAVNITPASTFMEICRATAVIQDFDELSIWNSAALTEPQLLLDWNGGAGRTWPW